MDKALWPGAAPRAKIVADATGHLVSGQRAGVGVITPVERPLSAGANAGRRGLELPCAYSNQPHSGKLRIIENSTCYKPIYPRLALESWASFCTANACTNCILSANRRWADLPPHSRSHLGNADCQRRKSTPRQLTGVTLPATSSSR